VRPPAPSHIHKPHGCADRRRLRALAIFRNPQAAARSQFWLLGVMVGFTTLALWLLAQAREG
jgi:hypothetical protein